MLWDYPTRTDGVYLWNRFWQDRFFDKIALEGMRCHLGANHLKSITEFGLVHRKKNMVDVTAVRVVRPFPDLPKNVPPRYSNL